MFKNFATGFSLSIPLGFMYLWGFGGLSDADNSIWLILMTVLFIATLPGSLILLIVGFGAAFSGKIGEDIAAGCIYLSVVNALFLVVHQKKLQKEYICNP